MTPRLAIVIPSWNTRDLLAACLQSVAATRGNFLLEILVVDNGSTDGSSQMVRERFADVRVLVNAENVGFARACNQGIAATSAPYVLLLNSDARVVDDTLQALLSAAETL